MATSRFFLVFVCLTVFNHAHAQQAPLILDVELDMGSVWTNVGLEYYEGLDGIPANCRGAEQPPANPNPGYWIRCADSPGFSLISISLQAAGISVSPKYLGFWAYFPAGVEPHFRITDGGELNEMFDVSNNWEPGTINVEAYGITPTSTITILVEGAGVIVDKVMVGYDDDVPTTTPTLPTVTMTTTNPITTTTDSSITTTTQDPGEPFCPPTGVHNFPYPGNCTLYIRCFEGFEQVLSCDPFIFDMVDLICKPAEEAVCDEEFPVRCPPSGYEAFPHVSNCSKYYECFNGNAYEAECTANSYFDATPELLHCNYAELAVCHSECPPTGIAFVPIRASGCRWYKTCFNGQAANLECAANEVFSPVESQCVPAAEYTCPY